MKFVATFIGHKKAGYHQSAVSIPKSSVGLTLLDHARLNTNVSQLDVDLVSGRDPGLTCRSVPLVLNEDQARKSGRFENKCEIEVEVDAKAINEFYALTEKVNRSKTTGEVTDVAWVYRCRDKALLYAWADAGYPLDWT